MVESGQSKDGLSGRTLYIPRMTYTGARVFAAACRSIGIDARLTPPSDSRTLELGGRYLSGDECYPKKVTLGDFLKITELRDFRPERTAFFMPTADGPCRFGQYAPLLRKVLDAMGLQEVLVFSPTSANSYDGVGEHAGELVRTAWRALVAADILRKTLLKTRPYEINKGETDRVFEACLNDVCRAVGPEGITHKERLGRIVSSLHASRERFKKIPADYRKGRPFIGIVGEIFCRLNTFSNEDTVRHIEEQGGEAWLADMSEWIWYTNSEHEKKLRYTGKRFSKEMLRAKIKKFFQRRDEHALFHPFKEDLKGYEEQKDIGLILRLSEPYLPHTGALGEMVLNMGKAAYFYRKGVDGIIDISPFTCMNGITCEAIYPRFSRDHGNIPTRIFYFDGLQSDLDRDVGIFMELAKTYQRRKKIRRVYPPYFSD